MPPAPTRRPSRRAHLLVLAGAISAVALVACGDGPDPCAATDLSTDLANCGACGRACVLDNAAARCAAGACEVASCDPGFADLDAGVNGCEYACAVQPPEAESCNGIDDDCDGDVDEGFGVGLPCQVGVGACRVDGATVCNGTGDGVICGASPGAPGVESCNGIDDDCDGRPDEGLTAPLNTCVQTGPCNGARATCAGAAGWLCNYVQIDARIEILADGTLAPVETRCDGFDNNCNGFVDEWCR